MRLSRDGADLKIFALDNINGVLHACLDVLGLEIGIVIANNRLGGHVVPDQLQNRLNGNSRACHAGLSKMNIRAHLDSAHALNIHPPTVPQQAVRRYARRRGWTMTIDCMFDFASIAAILVLAVRPKHPPLWRTKFLGLTAHDCAAAH